ncbi:MAG: hypothetical protein BroJett024_44780 [Alphaproteobacteria bacterium]|nr:MAG: hypothetical protein BroJett024_44780 [Alphaproteobacteria bacterium]
MAFDDPKLPRAVARGEELFVGDDKEPYVRDLDERIYVEIANLSISGGFEPEDVTENDSSKVPVRESLSGCAKLEDKNNFAVAGMQVGTNMPIAFLLRAVPETETRFVWRATIGFNARNWEIDTEDEFWISAYVPPDRFETIIAAVRGGHVERIRLGMRTTMWTKNKRHPMMAAVRVVWHLAPPPDKAESCSPAIEWANLDSLTWSETCGPRTAPPDEDAELPKPAVVELPARVYSLLGGILAVLAFIAALLLFRR